MQSHLDDVQKDFINKKFETSQSSKDISSKNNLDLLIDGMGLFHENKFKESDSTFEEFNKRNLKENKSSFSREASGLLFGQLSNSYKPYMMDSLFVSYYQIWDLLALHDFDNARVVINQSYNRQQNMSIEYKKLIEENKEKISKNSEYQKLLNENAGDWLAFSDIMNPALMYLSGIYFLNMSEWDDAILYLTRASGMMPNNDFIKQDLDFAKKHQKPKNVIWEFSETDFAPRLKEKEISFFLPKVGIIYFSISQPYFDKSKTTIKNSQLLANVDAMFITEYSQYRINEILRAYTNVASKAVLQTSAYHSSKNNSSSLLLGLASTLYSAGTTNAEIRTWVTLPKNIYVKRTIFNKSDLNELNMGDNIKIKSGTNYLIYKRIYDNNVADTKIINLTKGEK